MFSLISTPPFFAGVGTVPVLHIGSVPSSWSSLSRYLFLIIYLFIYNIVFIYIIIFKNIELLIRLIKKHDIKLS